MESTFWNVEVWIALTVSACQPAIPIAVLREVPTCPGFLGRQSRLSRIRRTMVGPDLKVARERRNVRSHAFLCEERA